MNHKSFVGLIFSLTLLGGASALGQQQAPTGDTAAIPPDQPTATIGQPVSAPQPSEIEEQQIEQQQTVTPQSPG